MTPLEILLAMLARSRTWPLPGELKIRRQIALWAALRESDEPALRRIMNWPADRELMIDNLPEKIASAFGDLLFGDDPDFDAADVADEPLIEAMVEPWAAELPAAEETRQSEGEVWWRMTTDPALPHPILSWHSRADVVPLLRGRDVIACAFVSQLPQQGSDRQTIDRHIELHGRGVVMNTLWRGRHNVLGQRIDLGRRLETAELPETWDHQIDSLLAGRIVRRFGRRPAFGISRYAGIWTRFIGLNEATTVGRENMRLTAKKRAVVPQSALRQPTALNGDRPGDLIDRGDGTMIPRPGTARPTFDAGESVLIADPLDVTEGDASSGPFKILEYSFDAVALIEWLRFEIETICQRADIVPQFIGSGDFGNAPSGSALRVRLLPTVNAATAASKPWQGALPEIGLAGQLLEAQAVPLGGLGRAEWTNAGGRPSVTLGDTLPIDDSEVASTQATLKNADLLSIETAVRERYPDREDEWITAEVDRIRSDTQATMPAPIFGGNPGQ